MSSHDSQIDPLEDWRSLIEALTWLPTDQRVALELKQLEGWSLAAIAQRMQRSEMEVASLLRRGVLAITSMSIRNSQISTACLHSIAPEFEQRLDAVVHDYLQARDAGLPVDQTCLLKSHVDIADELKRFFTGMDCLATCPKPTHDAEPSVPTRTLPSTSNTVLEADRDSEGESLPFGLEIPDFQILKVLGKGGMGIVYLAQQVSLPRKVALKMIHSSLLRRASALSRFRDEANSVARLNDSHIVQIHAIGEHSGEPYCVLEYVPGGTLASRLNKQPQPPREAAEQTRVLALTIHKVHQEGIVHLDLKPANVLLAADGTLKITDFGLARFSESDSGPSRRGEIAGTPSYMAPEQAAGRSEEIGPTSDVYALGAILYEMLTGRPPFKGETPQKTLELVLTQDLVPVRTLNPTVHRDLEAIVHRCLKKDPSQRYASAEELASRLQLFLAGEPIPERPRSWYNLLGRAIYKRPMLSSFVALLLLAIVTGWLVAQHLDPERPRKELQSTLAAGREYVFRGDEPLPGPFRQVYGEPAPLARATGESHLAFESHRIALWELTTALPCDRYAFSAEVRHDASSGDSAVGIYFGFMTLPFTDEFEQGAYQTLHFADLGSAVRRQENGRRRSHVRHSGRLFRQGEFPDEPEGPGMGIPFEPAFPLIGPGPWRTLHLVVTPEKVEASWEPEPGNIVAITQVSAVELQATLSRMTRPLVRFRGLPVVYDPTFGIGLFVARGKASFRNITVTPLRGD